MWRVCLSLFLIDWIFLGANVYYTTEEYAKAIEDGQRAIEIDPNYGKAYYRLGMAYNEIMGQADAVDKSIEMFERAA